MVSANRMRRLREGFSSTFWIANSLELFERLAFYGMKAVLTVFLANKVGLHDEAGTLAGLFSGMVFLLPVLAGVLVDKYGFRKTLMACFFIYSIGYLLIGLGGMHYGEAIMQVIGRKTYIISALMITAMGGSLIKPCIVGTVSMTSREDVRSLGFSIYYTLANVGGALGPIIALQVREEWGIEHVLIMSSITSAFLFVGTFLFFREPPAPADMPRRTFGQVFGDMLLVFGNARFMALILIMSVYWLMFWHIFYLLPFYGTDVLHFAEFELLETIDAACIIFLTVPMTALVQKWKPITALTAGLLVSGLSWAIIGAFPTLTATIIGVAVWAIGEAMQTPRFYEYVSNLAPKGQVGTFMGFAFLPVALGSFGAGRLSDWLRTTYLHTNPAMMWYILTGIGIACTLMMVVYNAVVSRAR